MDEQEAREQVKPLGNVERLAPGEEVERRGVLDLLYPLDELPSSLDELPLLERSDSTYARFVRTEAEIDVEELRLVERTLRLMGVAALADQIDRALGGRR